MTSCPTFWARIYCGLREGYLGRTQELYEAEFLVHSFCNSKPMCVTVTPTAFFYKNFSEPGFIVGLINYPRFPVDNFSKIKENALELAAILKRELKQNRVTVEFPDETVMLGEME